MIDDARLDRMDGWIGRGEPNRPSLGDDDDDDDDDYEYYSFVPRNLLQKLSLLRTRLKKQNHVDVCE